MTRFDQATSEPFFRRPVAFWLIVAPLSLIVVALVLGLMVKDRTDRAALAEQARSYDSQAQAIDEARERSVEREQARRSASLQ
ncbi:MAG: hypothetical protein EON85_03230 [Brevundimonas sp.]|nr:MAG: hypothetical protein EON85_03230 [Brevundimonas sp.]